MKTSTIIARPGPELTVKSRTTRIRFLKRLTANLEDALERGGVPFDLSFYFYRYLIDTPEPARALDTVARVFGLGTYSLVEATVPSDMDAIRTAAVQTFATKIQGKSFAVRARRQGALPFSSSQLEREIGAALVAFGKVNLTHPEVTVQVEALGDRTFLFGERARAALGLPGTVQGRALALMSGGTDSAVAAWRMMRRGLAVDFVLCNLGGKVQERQVLQVCKALVDSWGHGQQSHLFVVDFSEVVANLRERVRPAYWQVVLKRLMLRAAQRVANEHKVQALVTGDAIGQVSSQTMNNLKIIDQVADLPVLRPLAGYDKQEIIDEAKRIGLYEYSEHTKEFCAMTSSHPITCGKRRRVEEEEEALDAELLATVTRGRSRIDLRALAVRDLCWPFVLSSSIPAGAAVLDCQPPEHFDDWHVPGATNCNPHQLAQDFSHLSREPCYFLYCGRGTVAPHLAEKMQRNGYQAYAFRGRLPELKRYVAERHAAGESAGRGCAE